MDIRLCAHGSRLFARADAILLHVRTDRNSHPRGSRAQPCRVTKIQPKMLFQRALEGRVLYTHVVSRRNPVTDFHLPDSSRAIVIWKYRRPAHLYTGPIQRVGENLRVALDAADATLENLVKTTTFVTDIDEFFPSCRCSARLSRGRAAGEHHC